MLVNILGGEFERQWLLQWTNGEISTSVKKTLLHHRYGNMKRFSGLRVKWQLCRNMATR